MRASPSPALEGFFRDDLDLTDLWRRPLGPPVLLAGHGPDGVPILLVGDGPAAGTCVRTLVSRRPVTVYDVNGFYARLGVSPDAGWSAVRSAYMALGGQQDAELTEILMILKDPVTRAAYDRMWPHQRFADSATVTAIARAEGLRARQAGIPLSSDNEYESARFRGTDAQQSWQESAHSRPGAEDGWGYSHYLWGVLSTPSARAGLPDWQAMVAAALDDDGGPPLRFGVGRHALGSATAGITVGDIPVAFLSAGTVPQPQEAQRAATQLRALTSH